MSVPARAAGRAGGSTRGFTLVELLMVIVVLAALAAVAVPRFSGTGPFDERAFLDEALAAARYARALAVASGCGIQFKLTGGKYELKRRKDCVSGPFNEKIDHPSKPGDFKGEAPDGIGASPEEISFDAIGRPRDRFDALLTAPLILTIGTLSFTVEPQTGYAYRSGS